MMSSQMASVCPLDCPDTCSLTVTVEDGKVAKVRGSRANPYTDGVVCTKVTKFFPDFVHGENRLTQPLKRVGRRGEGAFRPITWDEALDEIHARFSGIIAEFGPQAIMPLNYAGPHGLLAMGSMDLRFFHKLGASLLDRRALCGGIRSNAYVGMFGTVPGMRPERLVHSKMIIVWGNNVTYSNLHLAPLIKKARQAGAKVVVVDPKRIKVAEQADLHLAVRPGTDVILAWAIAAELERIGAFDHAFIAEHVQGAEAFMAAARSYSLEEAADICGVPADQIKTVAAWYHALSPAAIALGNGLERNQNGGSGIRAVHALPALAGKFGVVGGGLVSSSGLSYPKTVKKLQRQDLIPAGTRTLNIIDVGRHLTEDALDPPLKGLFIYNHNPVIVHPDQNRMKQGLAREYLFIVGCDIAMTDSMAYCDIVLPACSHFEHDDLFAAYGQEYLQRAAPVIPRVGEALPNTEIFRRLAARFGFNDPIFQATDAQLMDDAVDGDDPRLNGTPPSQLPVGTALSMLADAHEQILFKNATPATPSGKVELQSTFLAERFGQPLPTYRAVESIHPLTLITPSSDKRITSTFGGVDPTDTPPVLEMHPDDAKARGLTAGMTVRVWNDLGQVHLPLAITDAVRPGCVFSEKGAWFKTSDNGQTVSALAPTHKADIAEGACYNDTRVEVAAAAL